MGLQKVTGPKSMRYSEKFWKKVEKLAGIYQVSKTGYLRMKIEEILGPALDKELITLKEERKAAKAAAKIAAKAAAEKAILQRKKVG